MKKNVCKILLFLLKKLGMEKELSIDYYENVNGNWTFLTNIVYRNISSPPRIGEDVRLFVNNQYVSYTVVKVVYDADRVLLHIE